MPIFKDFAENGELLQSRHESLNSANIERYIKQYGVERVKGYLDALIDLCGMIGECTSKFEDRPNEIIEVHLPENVLREKVQDLYLDVQDSITLVEETVEKANSCAGFNLNP